MGIEAVLQELHHTEAVLQELRQLVIAVRCGEGSDGFEDEARSLASAFADRFSDLDEVLTAGGFPPADWE